MSGVDRLIEAIRPGDHIYVAGSSGEPIDVLNALAEVPERTRNLRMLTSAIAGINRLDIDGWHESAQVTGLFMQPGLKQAHRDGRYRWLPLSYGGFVDYLRSPLNPVDTCIVQLAPAGPDGRYSLGLAAEFMPLAVRSSKRVLGFVNHAMPAIANAPSLGPDEVTILAELDAPLRSYETGAIDSGSQTIAALIAQFIPDGAALQIGIGKVPAALGGALTGHRNIRLQGGIFGDGFRVLADAGSLDPDWLHQACVVIGTTELYKWIADRTDFSIAASDTTHDVRRLISIDHLVSVNSAIEVDLFGQCNLEHVGGAGISGAGGAPDFARAAKLSNGGISIVALPATAMRGKASRILAQLSAPSIASLARTEVDIIVTEFGVADLRGCSVHERAAALIAIAAPEFREDLARQWTEMRDVL